MHSMKHWIAILALTCLSLPLACGKGESASEAEDLCIDACEKLEVCIDSFAVENCIEDCEMIYEINLTEECEDASIELDDCILDFNCTAIAGGSCSYELLQWSTVDSCDADRRHFEDKFSS
jgi:hypothetical protein